MKIKVAIIGCGNIAGGYDETKKDHGCYTHAGAYRRFKEVEIVAAVDSDRARLRKFGAFWKVPHLYTDAKEMLAHHAVDVLSITVPDSAHAPVMDEALRGRPPKVIFIEKPMASSAVLAKRLLSKAKAKNVKVIVNSQRRWDENHQRVRSMLKSGRIGRVVSVSVYYVKGLYHVGCTAVDTVRFLVSEVEAVQALAGTHRATVPGDPSMDAALYLKNKALATIRGVDRFGYRYSLFEVDILGTIGRIQLTQNGDNIVVEKVREYRHYPGFGELAPHLKMKSTMGEAIPAVVSDIVRFVSRREPFSVHSVEEAVRDLSVLDAIRRSQRQGGVKVWVR